MAETVVPLARDKLLLLLRDEAVVDLPQGIHREFEEIQEGLQNIQDLLIATDAWDAGDYRDLWMEDVSQACLRIENVIDRCMIYIEQVPRDGGCVTSLSKVFYFIATLRLRRQIASDIRQIKSIVDDIKQIGSYDHFRDQEARAYRRNRRLEWDNLRKFSYLCDEDQVVGFEGPKDELIGWLVEGPAELSVISVVGMGGIGKTTLVSTVFKNRKVIEQFDFHGWIVVTPSYTVEGLMRDLLKLCKVEMENTPEGISVNSLIDQVRNHLQGKRYAVIFDDVWSVEFWDSIESAMLDNKNGSRILITTRKKDVVLSFKGSSFNQVYELKPLSQEESMKLFCKRAFHPSKNGYCPNNLRKISSDFVEKCKGLPLAIVVIGNHLYFKTPSEWEELWRSLCVGKDKNRFLIDVTKVLELSYDDLPYHLKPCLLYFGMYPEGYEVKSTRLIRHWIAEGSIQGENGKTLEDIAQQYLSELIDRSLVQVSSSTIDGRAKGCRVHDLVHNMILQKIKDFSFCQHISKEDESLSRGMFLRLSIAIISNDLMGSSGSSCTRSLFFLADENSALTNKFVQGIPTKYRLLKVLDFENSRMHSIPENWGNLTQLKYLSLREAWYLAGKLPKFISKLQKLEILDIRGTDLKEMPKEICKLSKLQHLLGNDMILSELKNGLGDMTSLQTLCHVNLTMDDDDGIELIKELGKLTQLRNLSLTGVKEEQGSALCSSINEMIKLEKLSIKSNEDEVIDLPDILSLPQLKKLCLNGTLKKFPVWVPQLQKLATLTLRNSKLTNDPMESLESIPFLLYLVIDRAYEGKSLHFKSGGFLQLMGLFLGPLDNLESIIIDEGALPCLSKLELWRIPELKVVPPGIQHLRRLEVFDIFAMSNEFNECIAPEDGAEYPIIQHVRRVTITPNFGERTRFIHHSSWHYNS